mmetsp:Transcript_27987/g.65074  ORF Transcript_27987/g.65074 Transcript_27987/m.65074 type:complete len:363 (-) Transcript_27987:30-1118(-)
MKGTAPTMKNSTNDKDEVKDEDNGMTTYDYGTHDQISRFTNATNDIAEYAGRSYTYGKEIWTLMTKGIEPTFKEPEELKGEDAKSLSKMEKYKMQLKRCLDNEDGYKRDKSKVFRAIMKQCTYAMKSRIETLPEYDTMNSNDDVKALLEKMKEQVYNTHNAQYEYWTMQATMKEFVTMQQKKDESLADFHQRFIEQRKVTENIWGKMIPGKMKGKSTNDQNEAREKYLACLFLAGVRKAQYQTTINEMNNAYLLGNVTFPSDTNVALKLLNNRHDHGTTEPKKEVSSEGASFLQHEPTFYACGETGHIARDCPDPVKKAANDKKLERKKKEKARKKARAIINQQHTSDDESSSSGESYSFTL